MLSKCTTGQVPSVSTLPAPPGSLDALTMGAGASASAVAGTDLTYAAIALPHPLKSLDELPPRAKEIIGGAALRAYFLDECGASTKEEIEAELEGVLPAILLFSSLVPDGDALHTKELKPLVDAINHQVLHAGETEIELEEVMKTLAFTEEVTEETSVSLSEWISCVSAIPRLSKAIKLHVDPLTGKVKTYVSLEARVARLKKTPPEDPAVLAALEAAVASNGFRVFKHVYREVNKNRPADAYSGKIDRSELLAELRGLVGEAWPSDWNDKLFDHDADLNGLLDEDEWLDTLAREAGLAAAVEKIAVPEPPPPPKSPRVDHAPPEDNGKHVAISDTLDPAVNAPAPSA